MIAIQPVLLSARRSIAANGARLHRARSTAHGASEALAFDRVFYHVFGDPTASTTARAAWRALADKRRRRAPLLETGWRQHGGRGPESA
jgi:hypothetical protein